MQISHHFQIKIGRLGFGGFSTIFVVHKQVVSLIRPEYRPDKKLMKRFNINSVSFIFLLTMNKWKHWKLHQYDSEYILLLKSIFQIFEMNQIPCTPMRIKP